MRHIASTTAMISYFAVWYSLLQLSAYTSDSSSSTSSNNHHIQLVWKEEREVKINSTAWLNAVVLLSH